MNIYQAIVAFVFGACLGSFLNVVIDRVPAGKSLLRPPSQCDACSRRLTAGEMVPIFSYLVLKGRCRTCGARVPVRVLLVELVSGLGAAGALLAYGLSAHAAYVYIFGMVLLALSLIDIEQGIVPHEIILPVTVVALVAGVLYPPLGWKSTLLGGGIALGILLLPAVIRPGGMGWGDVKLAPFLGLVLGFPSVLAGFFVAFIAGGVAAVGVIIARRGGRKTALPFVPFLAFGMMAGLLWGRAIIDWYLRTL